MPLCRPETVAGLVPKVAFTVGALLEVKVTLWVPGLPTAYVTVIEFVPGIVETPETGLQVGGGVPPVMVNRILGR